MWLAGPVVGDRHQRVEFAAQLASENAHAGAFLWMRADDSYGVQVAFDNALSRGIRGTRDWSAQRIVMDIPESAAVLLYGAVLIGEGRVYMASSKSSSRIIIKPRAPTLRSRA